VHSVANQNHSFAVLARNGRETQQDEGRPERVVYEITPLGKKTFYAWLKSMLGEPRREYNEFPAALATMMALSPAAVVVQLRRRRQALKQQLDESVSHFEECLGKGMPRLVMLDDEYKQVLLKAEIKWLDGLIADLESGEMTWTESGCAI
jgi:DNA-binding PadR family transcriptional regulator